MNHSSQPGKEPSGSRVRPSTAGTRGARNHLAVARGGGMVVVRVVGSGNMITAPALNDFLEEQRASGFRQYIFDLLQCRGLDSTFMGCMVGLCTALQRESAANLEPGGLESNSGSMQEMSPEDALAELQKHFTRKQNEPVPMPHPAGTFVIAANVSAECREVMNILGVDKFVKIYGEVDLQGLEATLLPEKTLPPQERRRLILQAHEHLVEIDKRNEAQFGAFLKTLSDELSKGS